MIMESKKLFDTAIKKLDNARRKNPITLNMAADACKKRRKDMHKGDCGRLLVIGGSKGLTGAPCLSANAALRSGCGLVTVACPCELNHIFEIKLTEAMTLPVPSENGLFCADMTKALEEKIKNADAVLVGPGMGMSCDITQLVKKIIRACNTPLIIDADALNSIAPDPKILKEADCPVIITPHIGEFARLTQNNTESVLKNKEELASRFASLYGCMVILKSHETIVANPQGNIFENLLGNPGMATGGSGDVLSGIVASFAAQKNDPLLSCLAGVFFHSLAGDMAAIDLGEYSLVAGDIINYLAYAIKNTNEKTV